MANPDNLDLPEENAHHGMVLGTNRSRLAMSMDMSRVPEQPATFGESKATVAATTASVGVSNPFAGGIRAYEPNNVLYDQYNSAYNAVQDSKAREAEKAAGQKFTEVKAPEGGPTVAAHGKVGAAIQAALALASRRVPYVWGGTTANGVDCSGLIAYAFRAAGITQPGQKTWPRYRAVDYGHMGVAVTKDQARPGDIVYYDEPGATDHVGIYLGNGKMVQAPTTGDVVKVSNVGNATSYRRVFDDDAFQQVATPSGGAYWGYGGNQTTWGSAPVTTDTIRRNWAPGRVPFGA